MKYKLTIKGWRNFLNENKNLEKLGYLKETSDLTGKQYTTDKKISNVDAETTGSSYNYDFLDFYRNDFNSGEKTKETETEKPTPAGNIEYKPSSNLSHVQEATKEMEKFRNGQLKEWDPEAWPHIAKYWKHIGYTWAEKGTLNGYYAKNRNNNWHWSAAFIQYCMRGNPEFQELRHPSRGKGNHQYYWRAAVENTELIKSGALNKGKWFYLTMQEAEQIGYQVQVGDILFQGQRPKHHGDIVVATSGGPAKAGGYQKIGGNLADSSKISNSKNTALITQNPTAYDLMAKFVTGGSTLQEHQKMTKQDLITIIKEELTIFLEKKKKKKKKSSGGKKLDRCARIAKRKYDVWPSAYASGAAVKCRQGKIWKNEK